MGQRSAVVAGGHDFAIGTGRANGNEVATVGAVQVSLLGKDVGRFADGPYDVVGVQRFVAADVLNLVIGLIEGRAYKVGESGVDNAELLYGPFLNI